LFDDRLDFFVNVAACCPLLLLLFTLFDEYVLKLGLERKKKNSHPSSGNQCSLLLQISDSQFFFLQITNFLFWKAKRTILFSLSNLSILRYILSLTMMGINLQNRKFISIFEIYDQLWLRTITVLLQLRQL
jgi:hypothetical protein